METEALEREYYRRNIARLKSDAEEAYPVDSGASIYSIAEWAADAR